MKKVMQSTEIVNATTTFSTIDQPVVASGSGTIPTGQPIAAKQIDNALLDAALSYARRGLLVLPLHNPVNGKCSCGKPNCKDIGKHPRTAHGLKDATTDPETIRGWWETSPDANIGIRTGEESNLLVIDIDPRHGGNESLSKLEGELGMLPVTPSVCTGGGGGHLWHAHPGVAIKNKTNLGSGGVDVRGDGGQVVAPPSLHASGNRYRWKDGQTLSDLPLPKLPDGWLKYLASKPSHKASEGGGGKVGEGSRNSTLTQLAGSMRRWGASASTIVAALHVHNNEACDPPLEESEVESIANSIAGYQPGFKNGSTSIPYQESDAGLIWLKDTGHAGIVPIRLTNFVARISTDILEDDGAEKRRRFELEVTLGKRQFRFDVEAAQFGSMNWVPEKIGALGMIYPGSVIRDHARAAIQSLSTEVQPQCVYAHTGWRRFGDGWAYLHSEGAITATGDTTNVSVKLPHNLHHFKLPSPPDGEELKTAIKSSLHLLDVAPDMISVPIFAAIWRPPLGQCDFTLNVAGPTGAGKSEMAALAQQHYGQGFNARNLPAGWSSTANSLEALAFTAKDALLVIDDFAPGGTLQDVSRMHRDAERLIRSQGNNSGRTRMRSDATLRQPKPPRGLILSTGEDVPRGHSTRARLFTIEISQKDVDWDQLTRCQVEAGKGEYAEAFAGYLQYIAPRYASIREGLRQQMAKWRTLATQSEMHKRTPEIVAELAVGLNRFLRFARSCEALSQDEAKEYWSRFWKALGDAASKQREQHHSEEPTTRFLSLITGVISSGSAHLADARDGFSPAGAKGRCIGWFDCDHVFLDPDTAFAEVQRLAREQGDALPISQKTLWKRMKDGGLLALHDNDRNLSSQIIDGHKRHLLALDAHRLPISADIKSHRNRTDFPEK